MTTLEKLNQICVGISPGNPLFISYPGQPTVEVANATIDLNSVPPRIILWAGVAGEAGITTLAGQIEHGTATEAVFTEELDDIDTSDAEGEEEVSEYGEPEEEPPRETDETTPSEPEPGTEAGTGAGAGAGLPADQAVTDEFADLDKPS